MFASCSDRVALFSSASGPALSQEAGDGKINVQSACSLNTVYMYVAFRVAPNCLKKCHVSNLTSVGI
jgi:hypothetical protein